jgi:hypothetical protein
VVFSLKLFKTKTKHKSCFKTCQHPGITFKINLKLQVTSTRWLTRGGLNSSPHNKGHKQVKNSISLECLRQNIRRHRNVAEMLQSTEI